ncbi:two-component system response regulator, partial [Candidatus Termititenax spirochaetophilus]
DIVMPDINGIELARYVRENPKLKDVHIFALTGMPMINEHNKVYFEKVILKPFQMETLIGEINSFFDPYKVAV